MSFMSILSRRALLAAPAILSALPAAAQGWQANQPVRLINAFPPGGSPDVLARVMAPHVQAAVGQPMVIENRAGAGGMIGARAATQLPADGHGVFLAAISALLQVYMNPAAGYSLDDFRPVTLLSVTPLVLIVREGFPARTGQEWHQVVRANPDRFTYATAGNGTPHHMAGELYMQMSGASIRQVAYRGTAPALTDLRAGTVDMMFADLGGAAAFIQQRVFTPLAVTTARRVPVLPDVPMMSETVAPGFEAYSWLQWWVPRATPDAAVARLNEVAVAALRQPDVIARGDAAGFLMEGTDVARADAFTRAEAQKWSNLIRERNLRATS
jgi:tripartite-type tricarboxylate transporter receptor subunit TctC